MKNNIVKGLLGLSIVGVMTGCGQNVPAVVSNMNNEDQCDAYNRQLLQVDQYLKTVENTSAFHLEEAAVALEKPQISTSNNKKDMLRDAKRRKADILEKMQTSGCESYKK